jgi:cyclopropane fatty-acyl-phospholipid synthase-like methyltransferase
MNRRPDAPATGRNKDAILGVLSFEFRDCRSVFEIGSGTGQHAAHFAAAMPWLVWQTSELPKNHDGIRAWIEWAGLSNVRMPVAYDAANTPQIAARFDAIFSANTAHIMSIGEVENMFGHVAQLLKPGGIFCLYGPFNEDGRFTSESNADFDASLRAHEPSMGIRDREELNSFSRKVGLAEIRRYAMPANNQILVWGKPVAEAE